MSGRTLHWRDGKLITNRKTDRRQSPSTPRHERPPMLLTFELPGLLGLGLTPGHHPTIKGVTIKGPRGHVQVEGRRQDWLLEQAVELLRELAPHGLVQPVSMHLTKENEPGPTISGPWERGDNRVLQILWNGKSAQLIQKHSSRPVLTRAEERRRGDRWLQSGDRARPSSPWNQ
jgi:hypothetical protein